MTDKQREKIDRYLQFLSDKRIHYPKSDDFIKKYQQSGRGYITLAYCMINKGESKDKDCQNYYEYLNSLDDYHKFSAFKYMDEADVNAMKVFDVFVDKKVCEPNQKWHWIVSYLGMWIYWIDECNKDSNMNPQGLTCPELILWLAEACDADFVDEIFDNAIKWKKNEITYHEWKNYAQVYMNRLEDLIINKMKN